MFEHFDIMVHILVPLGICAARVCDVTLGTIRIMYVAKGMRVLASILGFFEVMIWLFAIRAIMGNLTHYANYIAFAAGYAIGNYVGILAEEKLCLGTLMLRIITKSDPDALVKGLSQAGFGITSVHASGVYGPANVLLVILKRKRLRPALSILNENDPSAVYSVEELKSAKWSPINPACDPGANPSAWLPRFVGSGAQPWCTFLPGMRARRLRP